jgi:hypothetical protein
MFTIKQGQRKIFGPKKQCRILDKKEFCDIYGSLSIVRKVKHLLSRFLLIFRPIRYAIYVMSYKYDKT